MWIDISIAMMKILNDNFVAQELWRNTNCMPYGLSRHHKEGKGMQHLYSATSRISQPQQRFCVTGRAGVQPIGHRLSLCLQTLMCNQTAIRSPCLPFNGLHPVIPYNYIDHYSFTNPGGMEGWVGLFGWLIANTLPTEWSHVNHRSGIDQGKSVSRRPTS